VGDKVLKVSLTKQIICFGIKGKLRHELEFLECVMRNYTIKYVKILWSNQREREAT
jgi:hypothetical protein